MPTMKIRHPWLIAALGFVVAWVIRLWLWTVRYRYLPLGPALEPGRADGERFLYAFWHEVLLLPAYFYGRRNVAVLISEHRDGQLIANACRHLGYGLVRGSLGRAGAVRALREMLRVGRTSHLAFTPDGPRGPRRQVQPGLVFTASRTGMPIVPAGMAFRRPWRLRSWDRMALPRPWSSAVCVTGTPIRVPADADRDVLEEFRRRVEQEMLRLTDLAEAWVETGRLPEAEPARAA
jgi:lysophospholipid acyltransferase (LPLAT)-like uncharacterized protein